MSYTDGAPEPPPPEQGFDWTKYGGRPIDQPIDQPAQTDPGFDWTKYGGKPMEEQGYGKAAGSGLTRGVAGVVASPPVVPPEWPGANAGSASADWVQQHLGFDPRFLAPVRKKADELGAAALGATKGTAFDPSYEPQDFGGKVVQTAASFAPYLALPGGEAEGVVGALKALPGRAVTEAAAPALGTEVIKQTPIGEAHPELAALLGAVAGGSFAKAGLEAGARAYDYARPPVAPETIQQFKTLGMPPLPRFAATPSGEAAPGTSWAASTPMFGGVVRSAAKAGSENIRGAAGRLFDESGAQTPYQAGTDVATSYGNWQKELSDKATAKYGEVENALPVGSETVTSPLSNTQAAADAITARNAASGAGPGAAVGAAQGGLDMGNMGYQGMRDLRTQLREASGAAGVTPTEKAQYGDLQKALTDDINTHLDRLDPTGTASAKLKDADQTYASDQGRLQAVGRRLGIDSPNVSNEQYLNKIESMAGSKAGKDIDTLQQTMQALPPKVRDQTAGSIAKNWWTDASGKTAPENFATKYDALSDAGKDALFGPSGSGGLRDSYDALSAVAKRDKILQTAGQGSGGMSGLWHLIEAGAGAGAIYHGGLGAQGALEAATTMAGPAVMPYLLSRPATASSAARLARAKQGFDMTRQAGQATEGASRIVAAAANNFAQAANQAGANLDGDQLTRQITGQ